MSAMLGVGGNTVPEGWATGGVRRAGTRWGSAAARAIAIAVSLLGVFTASALAQDDAPQVREAREHFAAAEQHYANGAYALSLGEFQRVAELLRSVGHSGAGVVMFNIARCHVALGRQSDAIRAYEQFLAEAPSDTPQRPTAERELGELRARSALAGGSSPPAAPSTTSGGGGIAPLGLIIAGVGAAAIVAGAVTGGLALARDGEAREGCENGHCPATSGPAADEAHTLALATDFLLFGGLAIAATGVVLALVLPEGSSATAGCTLEGCGVLVAGRF